MHLPGVGTNRYAHSDNDPVNKSDPSGHFGVVGAVVGAVVGIGVDAAVNGPSISGAVTSGITGTVTGAFGVPVAPGFANIASAIIGNAVFGVAVNQVGDVARGTITGTMSSKTAPGTLSATAVGTTLGSTISVAVAAVPVAGKPLSAAVRAASPQTTQAVAGKFGEAIPGEVAKATTANAITQSTTVNNKSNSSDTDSTNPTNTSDSPLGDPGASSGEGGE
jgi:hypothetical protein